MPAATRPTPRRSWAICECPTNVAGSSDQSTISIFSPCNSSITARARAPIGPMSEPLGLTPARCERTAIFVRCPASRATAMISTMRSLISGTSRANNCFTSAGWLRDNMISGPFNPCFTSTTKHLMRSPWLYTSPGTCSCGGIRPSNRPRFTRIIFGSRPC